MLAAHLILLGKLLNKTSVDVSNGLFPYRTVLLRFGTSDVVDADRNVLAGVDHVYPESCLLYKLVKMKKQVCYLI